VDSDFIKLHVPEEYFIGSIGTDQHVIEVSRGLKSINSSNLGEQSINALENVLQILKNSKVSPNERYKRLCDLHLAYVSQVYIKERFGDLSTQIERDFNFERKIKDDDK
jgi:hypothetical protein